MAVSAAFERDRQELSAIGMKRCAKCRTAKPVLEFGVDSQKSDGRLSWCRLCANTYYREKHKGNKAYSQYQMDYRKSTPERKEKWTRSRRKTHFKSNFGITLEQWEEMKEAQGNKCAICRTAFTSNTKRIQVDHDHTTGQVRDLLCYKCNTLLGQCDDSIDVLQAAISYLRRHAARQ
jgi:hypothetical protein